MKKLFLFLNLLCFALYAAPGPVIITVTSPLTLTNGNIAIPAASGSVNGYLTSANFNTFNNKLSGSILTTKGDLLGYSSTTARVPVGTNGQVLTADSSQTLGVKWADTISGVAWGDITGTLSNQTDLASALALKAPLASPTFSGTIGTPLTASRVLTTDVSGNLAASSVTTTTLAFVDPTSSIQTQLNAKQASGNYITALTGDVTASGPGSVAASISDATVTGKVLTGFSSSAGAVAATDTILQGFNKVVGNIALKANAASPVFTGTITTPLTASRALATGASSELAVATTTLTQLNYLGGATGTTGTTTTNLVFSTAPTLEGPVVIGGAITGANQGLNVNTTFTLSGAGASGIRSGPALAAGSTATFVRFFSPGSVTLGSGASVTNVVEFYSNGQTAGTWNAALADNTSFSGSDFFINQSGTRASKFGGTVTVANLNLTGNSIVINSAGTANQLNGLYGGSTSDSMNITGGSNLSNSSVIKLYGTSHASKAGQMELLSGGTVYGLLSSGGLWTFGASGGTQTHVINGNLSIGTGALLSNSYHLEITEYNQGNSSTAVTVNFANGSAQKVTLTGNATFTFSGAVTGGTYLVKLVTDSGGPYTQTWPAAVLWNNSAIPVTGAASATDYVSFYYDGTNYRGSFWTEAVPSVFAGAIGSAGSPTFTFTANLTSGMYQSATNNVDWATNGTRRLNLGATGALTMMTSSGANLLWNTNSGGNIGAGTSSTITNAPTTIYFNSRLQGNSQSGSNANFYVDVSSATGDLELFNGARTRIIGLLADGTYGYLVVNGAGTFLFDGSVVRSRKTIQEESGNTIDIGASATPWRTGYFGTSLYVGGSVASAALAVTSTTKGFGLPAMTTTQKNAISSPAAGLMVYDVTLGKACVFTTGWETITSL